MSILINIKAEFKKKSISYSLVFTHPKTLYPCNKPDKKVVQLSSVPSYTPQPIISTFLFFYLLFFCSCSRCKFRMPLRSTSVEFLSGVKPFFNYCKSSNNCCVFFFYLSSCSEFFHENMPKFT